VNRHALLQVEQGAAPAGTELAPAELVARQPAVPVILLGGAVVDKPVDRLVTDYRLAVRATQPAGDLLGRPALQQAFAHRSAQLQRGGELVRSPPLATPVRERLRAQRSVTSFPGLGRQAVAPQLQGNGRHGATEASSDRPLRFTGTVDLGENKLYPAWQAMQYMRNMFDGRAKLEPLDNDRFPRIRWTTARDVLSAHQNCASQSPELHTRLVR
jgi:hypothetical protein